jgi:hypothetical protein
MDRKRDAVRARKADDTDDVDAYLATLAQDAAGASRQQLLGRIVALDKARGRLAVAPLPPCATADRGRPRHRSWPSWTSSSSWCGPTAPSSHRPRYPSLHRSRPWRPHRCQRPRQHPCPHRHSRRLCPQRPSLRLLRHGLGDQHQHQHQHQHPRQTKTTMWLPHPHPHPHPPSARGARTGPCRAQTMTRPWPRTCRTGCRRPTRPATAAAPSTTNSVTKRSVRVCTADPPTNRLPRIIVPVAAVPPRAAATPPRGVRQRKYAHTQRRL